MKLTATVQHHITAAMDEEMRRIDKAVVGGIKEAGRGLKGDLRKQVVSSGLGTRLARTWRDRAYPNKGRDAATLVWSKAPQLIRIYDKGALIKSDSGYFLAIPTAQAPKYADGRKKINPTNFPEHRYGPLRFVYRRGRPSLLVVDGVRINRSGRTGRRAKGGMFTKTGRMKQGMTTVVMFILVPRVKIKKRLNVEQAISKWERKLPGLIDKHIK
ncbi:MAG: hypothetical protein GY832_30080 [Chloroflexi bacterium]|nr:hypothetical protein [Chloroflexota bacterium]